MPKENARGVYRAIYVTIWDDPDFRKLPPTTKFIFLYLRTSPLSNMPCVFPYYLEAIERHTGISRPEIKKALDTLSDTHWVRVEDGYLWIRNGLRYDPNIYLDNPKHIAAIKKYLSGLPRLRIIKEFCEYYQIEYPMPYGMPYPMPITEKEKEPEKEEEKEKRERYGVNENILLSKEEHEKLSNQFGEKAQEYIDSLSFQIASTGRKYKSHYMTILNWERNGYFKTKKEDKYL